jgi:hypothetical protein
MPKWVTWKVTPMWSNLAWGSWGPQFIKGAKKNQGHGSLWSFDKEIRLVWKEFVPVSLPEFKGWIGNPLREQGSSTASKGALTPGAHTDRGFRMKNKALPSAIRCDWHSIFQLRVKA